MLGIQMAEKRGEKVEQNKGVWRERDGEMTSCRERTWVQSAIKSTLAMVLRASAHCNTENKHLKSSVAFASCF